MSEAWRETYDSWKLMSPWDEQDAKRDADSDARYEDDPQAEVDNKWRETRPAKGCDS